MARVSVQERLIKRVDDSSERASDKLHDDELARETFIAATAAKLFAVHAMGFARAAYLLSLMCLVGIMSIIAILLSQ